MIKGGRRPLIDHYYSGKLTARDDICEEYVNSEEGVIIEEAVCPGDCDAQLVFERCRGRQEERNSREEGLD